MMTAGWVVFLGSKWRYWQVAKGRALSIMGRTIIWGSLSVCLYFCIAVLIEPSLIYHKFGIFCAYPVFFSGLSLFTEYAGRIGGLVEYAGAFLSQWYYYSWIGAFAVTAVACVMCAAVLGVAKSFRWRLPVAIFALPALWILADLCGYEHSLNMYLAFTLALLALAVFAKLPITNTLISAAVCSVLTFMLYYAAGGWAIVFTAGVCILAIVRRTTSLVVAGVLSLFAAIFILGVLHSSMGIQQACVVGSPFMESSWQQVGMQNWRWAAICIFIVIAFVIDRIVNRPVKGKGKKAFGNRDGLCFAVQTVLVFTAAAAICVFAFDRKGSTTLQLERSSRQGRWNDVYSLSAKASAKYDDIVINHYLNRSLWYENRLGEEMFSHRQRPGALILMTAIKGRSTFAETRTAEMLIDIGHLAMAEKLYFEQLEQCGPMPSILEAIATINIVKGDRETARYFLEAMSRDVIYHRRAEEMLSQLHQPDGFADDRRLSYLKSIQCSKDVVDTDLAGDNLFALVLDTNDSPLALEAMMSMYMLTGAVDKVAGNIWRLDKCGYKKLPCYYEEAIIIAMGRGFDINKIPPHLRPGKDAIARSQAFGGMYGSYGPKAPDAMAEAFGKSYFYYYAFKKSGVN